MNMPEREADLAHLSGYRKWLRLQREVEEMGEGMGDERSAEKAKELASAAAVRDRRRDILAVLLSKARRSRGL
jgi:hypothetical protein